MLFQLGLVVLTVFTSPVQLFRSFAPNTLAACKSLKPEHSYDGATFFPEQSSPPPYAVELSKKIIKPKETITLTLKATTEENLIKGFMFQVRANGIPVGQFENSMWAQAITCQSESDTVSHRKIVGNGLNETSFRWTAPDNLNGPVSILGSVVANRTIFWVADKYAELTVSS